jgi:hypothetical protein
MIIIAGAGSGKHVFWPYELPIWWAWEWMHLIFCRLRLLITAREMKKRISDIVGSSEAKTLDG